MARGKHRVQSGPYDEDEDKSMNDRSALTLDMWQSRGRGLHRLQWKRPLPARRRTLAERASNAPSLLL
jgi:hypothetical protein